jgi:hypothetical protein
MPIIISLTVVNADWKEVWSNAVKRNWNITYFTSVLGSYASIIAGELTQKKASKFGCLFSIKMFKSG